MPPEPLTSEPPDPVLTALRRAVFEAPSELNRRRVLADWLLDHGDPHGEFISLQFEPASRPARRRADKLLRRYRTHFLGPLASHTFEEADERWAHGFVVHARLTLPSALIDEPAIATLQQLTVPYGDPRVLKSKWLQPSAKVRMSPAFRRAVDIRNELYP